MENKNLCEIFVPNLYKINDYLNSENLSFEETRKLITESDQNFIEKFYEKQSFSIENSKNFNINSDNFVEEIVFKSTDNELDKLEKIEFVKYYLYYKMIEILNKNKK